MACVHADRPRAPLRRYAYWIEWNLDTQTMRIMKKYGVDAQSSDEGFLDDYVFSSLIAASVDGSIIIGTTGDIVVSAYGTKTRLDKLLDEAYKTANNGAACPIQ